MLYDTPRKIPTELLVHLHLHSVTAAEQPIRMLEDWIVNVEELMGEDDDGGACPLLEAFDDDSGEDSLLERVDSYLARVSPSKGIVDEIATLAMHERQRKQGPPFVPDVCGNAEPCEVETCTRSHLRGGEQDTVGYSMHLKRIPVQQKAGKLQRDSCPLQGEGIPCRRESQRLEHVTVHHTGKADIRLEPPQSDEDAVVLDRPDAAPPRHERPARQSVEHVRFLGRHPRRAVPDRRRAAARDELRLDPQAKVGRVEALAQLSLVSEHRPRPVQLRRVGRSVLPVLSQVHGPALHFRRDSQEAAQVSLHGMLLLPHLLGRLCRLREDVPAARLPANSEGQGPDHQDGDGELPRPQQADQEGNETLLVQLLRDSQGERTGLQTFAVRKVQAGCVLEAHRRKVDEGLKRHFLAIIRVTCSAQVRVVHADRGQSTDLLCRCDYPYHGDGGVRPFCRPPRSLLGRPHEEMGQPAGAPGHGEPLVQVGELEEPVPLPRLGVRKPDPADLDTLEPLEEHRPVVRVAPRRRGPQARVEDHVDLIPEQRERHPEADGRLTLPYFHADAPEVDHVPHPLRSVPLEQHLDESRADVRLDVEAEVPPAVETRVVDRPGRRRPQRLELLEHGEVLLRGAVRGAPRQDALQLVPPPPVLRRRDAPPRRPRTAGRRH
ncbi:hypothetical protein THAOC_05471 [Thalassiosira oceanica]|uniref:Uncharacterized protein n=1 Tax=Thalassiosira oceanica TaxID=159749 RepID=K0TGZ6_THAOC|nr:hypothetical protein THAOC_05471 [Thalassiosira oceanica]|eukprot:EJK72946.1 hypothetical protein THAOC_05471 [Thalassiosira oceanica]